jgi:hypothetical protein
MTDTGWRRLFDEPIPLPRGRELVTLKDAGTYMTGRRPNLVPRSFARVRPALTRSRIIPRSNSAKTPHI